MTWTDIDGSSVVSVEYRERAGLGNTDEAAVSVRPQQPRHLHVRHACPPPPQTCHLTGSFTTASFTITTN
eukprot:3809995-Pyramimonas_sp.AAC.1